MSCDGYVYRVPFVEEADHFFLKTLIASILHKYVTGRLQERDARPPAPDVLAGKPRNVRSR